MKILLLGAPGAGKGTQAKFLMKHFSIPQISTGDLLRNELQQDTPLAKEIKQLVDAGKLVDDAIVLKLVRQRVNNTDCQQGYLLDGYPRNLSQAKDLEQAGINLDVVIEFDIDPSLIIERISGRRFHLASGRSYHIKYNPPKIEGIDDFTGEELVIRNDDNPEIINQRLNVYHQQTVPLIDYYSTLARQQKLHYIKINGSQSVEEINQQLIKALEKL